MKEIRTENELRSHCQIDLERFVNIQGIDRDQLQKMELQV